MILVRLTGGLGNQMFQYAAAYALAKKHNTCLKIDTSEYLDEVLKGKDSVFRGYGLDIFNLSGLQATAKEIKKYNPHPTGLCSRVYHRVRRVFHSCRIYMQNGKGFDAAVPDLPDNVYLIGSLLQSEKYFSWCEGAIREEFQFKSRVDTSIADLEKEISDVNSVAIHVRRGDYVSNEHYRKILGPKKAEYYKKGIEVIQGFDGSLKLYVFSDDISWCQEHLDLPKSTVYVSGSYTNGDPVKDLMLLTRCKYFVIPNSTYSWWGAWLSNYDDKIVVAPETWSESGIITSDDILPSDWIRI